ncbi:hypothetical protein H0H87_002131 [Tephrocybe sp. NHM501043]|nr:hypothetical protein H0H87_002131 [Tephrocybe sp. NHM501043]
MSQQPRSIVIIGGGIIGCTTAYYLTHHPSYSTDTKITVVEASVHGAAQGASGKAGGLVARWAYPQPLVDVSFDEHVRLAELHGGSERWGWRYVNCGSWDGHGEELPAEELLNGKEGLNEEGGLGDRRKSLEKTLGLEGGKPLGKRKEKETGLPPDLTWMHSDLTKSYEPMAPQGDTAQVHPYLFTQSMLALAQDCGASFLPSTRATSITTSPTGQVTGVQCTITHAQGGRSQIPTEMITNQIHLDATHVVLAAGAWAPRLVPALPLTGTRAHSITIHPPARMLPIAPYVLFTEITLPPSSSRANNVHRSPEIYARPGPDGEVYACGPGDDAPLPESVDDVVVEPGACEDVWEEHTLISKTPSLYAMPRPSLLTANADPHEVLCHHFNVMKPIISSNDSSDAPNMIQLSILRPPHAIPDAPLPTHVLFAASSSGPPLMFPIHASLYSMGFRADLPTSDGTPPPVLNSSLNTITVPVVRVSIPHPPTLALLLLFALALEPSPHTALAYRLLPPSAVEEFPNSAAMAAVLARGSGLAGLVERNEGMWRNVLALGVSDGKVVEMVGMVWSVTKEARRARGRLQTINK